MSLFNKGEIVVKTTGTTTRRARVRGLLLGSVIFAIPLSSFQQVAGQYRNPYNGVSHTSQLAKFYDVANAMTFLLGVSLLVLTGKEVSDAESEQMIAAFNDTMGATPQFVSMTPRDKQILYESAVVMGGMIALLHSQGAEQKDTAMQSDAKELSRAVVKHFLGLEAR